MAILLDFHRRQAEPSLVIMYSGMPASWQWHGRLHEAALLHASWEDRSGRTWYRAESTEGRLFLLGRDRDGWTVAPLSAPVPVGKHVARRA